tara:strand:+ start:140 stop:868 length:729 start_codon:yes stop_codon:yes gene_type:complete
LAAGYATRLGELTKNKSKPLLEVANKPIVQHIADKVQQIPDIDEIFVVTNNKFYQDFLDWKNSYESSLKITIVNDNTVSNDDRLGAVGDIHFVIENMKVRDDLLVIAGDNLFGFSLPSFVDYFTERENKSIVAFKDLQDPLKVKGRYGVGILHGSQVIDFEEKPQEPRSTLAATACYLFSRDDLYLVREVAEDLGCDAPGNLVKHLATKSEMHGFVFTDHWFDIGSLDQLEEAGKLYDSPQS